MGMLLRRHAKRHDEPAAFDVDETKSVETETEETETEETETETEETEEE